MIFISRWRERDAESLLTLFGKRKSKPPRAYRGENAVHSVLHYEFMICV
jgi:hypothetical protein